MKGVVFTEFIELVEEKFGYGMVDDLILETNPASGGIYTTVGTYPFSELANMLFLLSKKTQISPHDLLVAFGHHLFKVFNNHYSNFFQGISSGFEFLATINDVIHVEVLKLYSDAELPKITTEMFGEKKMILTYKSSRSLSSLALGLIEKTFEHYKTPANINVNILDEKGENVQFIIELKD